MRSFESFAWLILTALVLLLAVELAAGQAMNLLPSWLLREQACQEICPATLWGRDLERMAWEDGRRVGEMVRRRGELERRGKELGRSRGGELARNGKEVVRSGKEVGLGDGELTLRAGKPGGSANNDTTDTNNAAGKDISNGDAENREGEGTTSEPYTPFLSSEEFDSYEEMTEKPEF